MECSTCRLTCTTYALLLLTTGCGRCGHLSAVTVNKLLELSCCHPLVLHVHQLQVRHVPCLTRNSRAARVALFAALSHECSICCGCGVAAAVWWQSRARRAEDG